MNLKEVKEQSKKFSDLGYPDADECAIAASIYGEFVVIKCNGLPDFARDEVQKIYSKLITEATATSQAKAPARKRVRKPASKKASKPASAAK